MSIKPRFTIDFLNGTYWLKDGGFTVSSFETEENAKAAMREQVILDGVSEYIEDAIIDLKRELAQRFGITLDKAHNLIKESL